MPSARLLVISGPTGIGKTERTDASLISFINLFSFLRLFFFSVLHKLLQKYPQKFEKVVTYTTRQPRSEEISGKHHHFVSREQMENQIKNGEFIGNSLLLSLKFSNSQTLSKYLMKCL